MKQIINEVVRTTIYENYSVAINKKKYSLYIYILYVYIIIYKNENVI